MLAVLLLAAGADAAESSFCDAPCRASTCGTLTDSLSCSEMDLLGCSCGDCCSEAPAGACATACRAETCGTMSLLFTCYELEDQLGCSCGGCCHDSIALPEPPPSLSVSEFVPYYSYAGRYNSVAGVVGPLRASPESPTEVSFAFALTAVDPMCAGGAGGSANSCGVHIHVGSTCDADALGHYYTGAVTVDPWSAIGYTTLIDADSATTSASGFVQVDTGGTIADLTGRAFIVHDYAGGRIACGLLSANEGRTCTELPPVLVPIGIVMGVFGSIGINIGQNLQADGIQALPAEYREAQQWRSKKWRFGMALFISFSIVNFAALAFAPASVLVPLESIQFVTNVCYSFIVHKKAVPPRMLLGVLLACVGTVFTVAFGAAGGGCHTLEQLAGTWATWHWWVFCSISIAVALISHYVHLTYDRRLKAGEEPAHHEYVQPITFTLTAALLGGAQMIVQSKVFSELLAMLFQGEVRVLTSWVFYLSLVLVIGCGMIWVIKMTICLGLYDPLLILPLMVATYILFGGIAGGLYFNEFGTLHEGFGGYGRWGLYIGGMCCVLLALYLIATAGIAAAAKDGSRPDATQAAATGRARATTIHLETRSRATTAAHMPAVEHPLAALMTSERVVNASTRFSRRFSNAGADGSSYAPSEPSPTIQVRRKVRPSLGGQDAAAAGLVGRDGQVLHHGGLPSIAAESSQV